MARAVINTPETKTISEINVASVHFDLVNLSAQVTLHFKYSDGSFAKQQVVASQTFDTSGEIPVPTANGIRDFFLVFRTATGVNDLVVKTLDFFKDQLGDVTVEA